MKRNFPIAIGLIAVICFVGFIFPNPAIVAGKKAPQISRGSSIKVVDLTHPMQDGMPIWNATWEFTLADREGGWYENFLDMSEHTGTHMDAPAHRSADKNAYFIDTIPPERLSGICVTMDMREVIEDSGDVDYNVTAADIMDWEDKTGIEIQEGDIVFMYTGYDEKWDDTVLNNDQTYIEIWPAIDPTAADLLLERDIKGFGIDTLSIDPITSEYAHVTLYGANIWSIENLDNLGKIPTISYVIVAPMKIKDGTGAPTRVWSFFEGGYKSKWSLRSHRRGHRNFAEEFDEKLSDASDLAHTLENGIPIWMDTWQGLTYTDRDIWGWKENFLDMSEHTGTHMDAPAHRIEGGWTIDEIPLDHLYGSAVVMDISGVVAASNEVDYNVTAADIKAWEDDTGIKIRKGDIVFMYTGYDELWGDSTYNVIWPAIDPTAADYLIKKGINGFGIDTMSLDPFTSEYAHVNLYGANIWGLENLDNLSDLGDSRCYVIVMPWLLGQGSGGPCRVIAFE